MANRYYVVPHAKVPELMHEVVRIQNSSDFTAMITRKGPIRDIGLFDFCIVLSGRGVNSPTGSLNDFLNWCKTNAIEQEKPEGVNWVNFHIRPRESETSSQE